VRCPLAGALATVLLVLPGFVPAALVGQDIGRRAAENLRFLELRFDPPEVRVEELSGGVAVYVIEDHSLPLVEVVARLQGGYSHLDRGYYAAGTALPGLLRAGGTATLAPDSVDHLLEFYAIHTSFGGGGGSTFSSLNTLSEHVGVALELWGEMLKRPGFDSVRVEVWRGQELESVRRRRDNPGSLAFSTFNTLMFGDHPIGWEMTEADLTPERLSVARLRDVHARVFCRENLMLGVTGDVDWNELRPALTRLVADWPSCAEPLPEAPIPEIRREPGVFLIPRPLEQSTVVLAHATGLRQQDAPPYFASRIGNTILGAGGLSSRLVTRVRSDEGLAYSVASLWTAPVKYDGLVGATTRTRADATVATIRLILAVLHEMRDAPPDADEVATAVEEATNGFVFNFDSASQIISRRMFYEASGLPDDWLSRYLRGIQAVRPTHVHQAFRRYLEPDRMVILVVGDPEAFGESLDSLGPVTVLDDGAVPPTSPPSGAPRSPS
jgi:predicted Zn-dependent peptidase